MRVKRVWDGVERVVHAVLYGNAADIPFDADHFRYNLTGNRRGLGVGDIKTYKRATGLDSDHIRQRQTETEAKVEDFFLYVLHISLFRILATERFTNRAGAIFPMQANAISFKKKIEDRTSLFDPRSSSLKPMADPGAWTR